MKLNGMFSRAANAHPEKVAVQYYREDGSKDEISYGSMLTVGNTIKAVISAHITSDKEFSKEFMPNKTFGIYCKANAFVPCCILGVLEAGYDFAFLNPASPKSVSKYFLKTAGISYVILQEDLFEQFCQTCSVDYNVDKHLLYDDTLLQTKIWYLCQVALASATAIDVVGKEKFSTDIAYTVSTSGTSGVPKIVRVPHSCIIQNVLHLKKLFSVSPYDKIALITPLTFDPSIIEMFVALTSGATLVVVPDVLKLNSSQLVYILCKVSGVTILQTTPSLLHRIHVADLNNTVFNAQSSLRVIAIGGEACPTCKTLKTWIHPSVVAYHATSLTEKKFEFFNLYGITEVSVWATYYRIPFENIVQGCSDPIPLGVPLSDTHLAIYSQQEDKILCEIFYIDADKLAKTDQTTMLVQFHEEALSSEEDGAICVQGYLWLGGHHRTCLVECSTDKDMNTPSNSKELESTNGKMLTIQNTGDIVQLVLTLSDLKRDDNASTKFFVDIGDVGFKLLYIGRSDSQIKRNAKRMNLLLVKNAIEQLEVVNVCHIIHWTEKQNTESIVDAKLLAFIVLSSPTSKSYISSARENIQQHLLETVDSHCVPDGLIFVGKMPVTGHGKVDENVLLNTFQCSPCNILYCFLNAEGRISETLVEECFYKCWISCLEGYYCSVQAHSSMKIINFIKAGGNSFNALRLVSMIESWVPMSCRFPDLLDSIIRKTFPDVLTYIVNCLKEFLWTIDSNPPSVKRCFVADNTEHSEANSKKSCHTNFPKTPNNLILKWSTYARCAKKYSHGSERKKSDVTHQSLLVKSWKLNLSWRCDTGKCVDASPLVILKKEDGFAIIGSHSCYFSCMNLASRQALWKVKLGGRIESSACMTTCGQYVVVGCYDKCVYFLRTLTGEVTWKFKTGGEIKSSPCAGWPDTSVIFVGSHDGMLYSLDGELKQVRWKWNCGRSAIFSSPCFCAISDDNSSTDVVAVGTLSGKVICVYAESGHTRWSTDLGKPVFSSPMICDIGTCVGCVDSKMYMLSNENGAIIWSYSSAQPIFSSPAVTLVTSKERKRRTVVMFGSHDGFTYCLDAKEGTMIWKYPKSDQPALPPVYSSPYPFEVDVPVAAEGIKIARHQLVATATTDGIVRVLELETGHLMAQQRLPGHVFSSPVVVTRELSEECANVHDPAGALCSLLIGCRDDHLYQLELLEVIDGGDT